VLLVRRSAFTKGERDALREIVPALAVGDALRQLVETRELRGLVAEVRCVDQRLTPRQRELVELVALGRTDAEIASALAISANTVRNQLVAVRRRLGAANRAELVRTAVLR
jgi:DNA-binding CsgD family transcriptional regulator